jgi:hypothetical protein
MLGYNHGSNYLAFTVNAEERVRIDSSGRVGINETSMSSFNSIADDLVISQSSGSAGVTIRTSTTGSGTLAFTDAADTTFEGDIRYVHDGDYMRFSTAGNERFRIDSSGHVLPAVDDTYDLGSSSYRWRDIYTGDLNLSNKGKSNDVDGSWGDYTIQEGESDLFLINNRSGKKFKFNLTEVL